MGSNLPEFFHVKSEWQKNSKISTPCFTTFSITKSISLTSRQKSSNTSSRRSSSSAAQGTPQKDLNPQGSTLSRSDKLQRSTWQTRSSLAARGPSSSVHLAGIHSATGTYPNVLMDFNRPNVAGPILGKEYRDPNLKSSFSEIIFPLYLQAVSVSYCYTFFLEQL